MRRFLFGLLASALVVATSACPLRACINDREVDISEREFKSSYMDHGEEKSADSDYEISPLEQGEVIAVSMAGAGIVLLGGAGWLCWARGRRREE